MALQSSSSFTYGFSYDVFLSFRGSDTRYGFTGNLWKALSDRGIHTFIDDKDLERGDEITPALVKAIEESRIAIPVFSNNYASSSFCLDELDNIIDRVKAKGRLVLPIFYDVDPSHVRHQTGSYGEALAKHEARFKVNKKKFNENMERLQKWKAALHQVANLSGHHFKLGNEYEHEFIGKIIKEVSSKISRTPLQVANFPVGLESRVLEVASLLDVASDEGVHMVGIYGTGGMGKTTLARALYNLIADQFEGLCFLHNVRENSSKHGLEHLQEKLLSKTVGLRIELGDVNEGIPIIKKRLYRKKVLLILDDVDERKQLQVTVGGLDWFGRGSRVIITTRDKQLLTSHGIERAYEVYKLDEEAAFELFRWNAFKDNKVHASYNDILNRAVTYASGLPLALEVIGSNLFGKSVEEWKSTLDRYERIPNKEIQKILKVSYDALDDEMQSVFLDIACCFKWYPLVQLENILHAHHGECMKENIRVLSEKCLIKINFYGSSQVTLHDLVEDMGKEIVRQESPKEPGKRSRLWLPKDIIHILEDNMGTCEIEIIYLDSPSIEAVVEWNGKAFKKMKNLKTLVIKSGHFSEGPRHLPSSLRVLEWLRYPSQCLPSNFHPKKLVICKLSSSFLTSSELACLLNKKFVNLKVLNFNECKYLTEIPDVSDLNLEEFSFNYCENLVTIHSSVGFLNRLKILSAEGCSKLRSFPPLELTSLEQLELSHCSSLKNFPEILVKMENIKHLNLMETSIEELPFSFGNLTQLLTLRLEQCGKLRLPSSILLMRELAMILGWELGGCLLPKQDDTQGLAMSSNVDYLRLPDCNLSDEFLPKCITWFANVKYLILSGNNFTILPECIKQCNSLWWLDLNDCKSLQEIRGIPPKLKRFSASGCESLISSSINMLLNQELHGAGDTEFSLPGAERVPEWFEHQSKGLSISFWFRDHIPSIVLCIVAKSKHDKSTNSLFPFFRVGLIINGYKCALDDSFPGIHLNVIPNHTYLYDLKLKDRKFDYTMDINKVLVDKEWNHVEVTCEDRMMKSMLPEKGIHVLKQESSMEDVRFTHPYKRRKLDDDHNSQ